MSYFAAGIVSHLASDGPEAWTVAECSRNAMLETLVRQFLPFNTVLKLQMHVYVFGHISRLRPFRIRDLGLDSTTTSRSYSQLS